MACSDCAKVGAFWSGKPSGESVTHEGTKAYVARPKGDSHKAILFISDIYGLDLVNNRLLADKYAKDGFLCVVPDYFGEYPVPLEDFKAGNLPPFLEWQKKNGPEVYLPLSDKFLQFLKSNGATSIGVVGYCWGARPAVLLANSNKVKAIVVNHASFLSDNDVKNIKQPVMFNGSDKDQMVSHERLNEFEKIAKGNDLPNDFKFFPGALHGWTCRGDDKDPELAPKILDAYERGIGWFKKHL